MIDAGAIIVDKVKLQAMIMREEPLECVEFSAPFNPRAMDTKCPLAAATQVRQLMEVVESPRITMAAFPKFEMLDFFGRDITKFNNFISVCCDDSPILESELKASVEILYPLDYFPTPNGAQTAVIDRLIDGLEKAFEVERIEISLADQWAKDLPDGDDNADL
ncbi:hypothetical protein ACHAPJ_013613 [Fusarium lateritium]